MRQMSELPWERLAGNIVNDYSERQRPRIVDNTIMIPLVYLTRPLYDPEYPKAVVYGRVASDMGMAIAKKLGPKMFAGMVAPCRFQFKNYTH